MINTLDVGNWFCYDTDKGPCGVILWYMWRRGMTGRVKGTKMSRNTTVIAALVIGMVPAAFGELVVPNASFEDPAGPVMEVITDWEGTHDEVKGWNNVYFTIPSGMWGMPTTPYGNQWGVVSWDAAYATSVPGVEGVTTAIWTNIGTVTDGMDYEVSWLEGVDNANPGSWGAPYDVSIWAGDASGPLVRLDVATITKGGAGTKAERSTILNAGIGQTGNDLWIMFSMTDLAEWNNCIVDNVHVEAISNLFQVVNPVPEDGDGGVDLAVVLGWQAPDPDMVPSPRYNVYFGTDPENWSQSSLSQSEANYSPDPPMLHGTRYFWQVDSVGLDSTVYPGRVWSFTTVPAALPCLPGDLNEDCRVDFKDVRLFAQQWLGVDCAGLDCADFDSAGGINASDFAHLAKSWLRSVSPVLISEFMAINDTLLEDEDGDFSDWIELHNRLNEAVDLDGWFLTDDEDELRKWRLPAVSIEAGEYLIMFASGKDRNDPNGPLHTNFKLDGQGEYLAIMYPDGTAGSQYAPEFPRQGDDVSYGLTVPAGWPELVPCHFFDPTPGYANGIPTIGLGPYIMNVRHIPLEPNTSDAIIVTAEVLPRTYPADSVTLLYRAMYQSEVSIAMHDDGVHGDGQSGDGVYGARIPHSLATPGQMLRYRIETTDIKGNNNRAPLPLDLIGVKQWPEYFGTMIADPTITSELPVLYWFTDNPAAAKTRSGTRASVYYNGEFYDNIFVRVRGSMGAAIYDPPPHKFIFNKCHKFRASDNLGRVGEFNLNVHGWDGAYVRQTLAFDTHHNAGVPGSDSFLMLVLLNGGSERVAIFVEQPDEDFLERNGMNPDGALYKWVVPGPLYVTLSDITVGTEVQKKTRLEEDWSDLEALVDGLNAPSEEARKRFVFDNLNIPKIVGYLAVNVIHMNADRIWKNFYLYRDSDGSDEWSILPWDLDWTYGIGASYAGGHVRHPFFGDAAHPFPKGGHVTEGWNVLYDVIFDLPETREMYLRHLRTLMDELLQSPGTPVNELKFEQRVDELAAPVYPHVNIAGGISGLKGYFPARRTELYQTYGPSGTGLIPGAQHANPVIRFGAIEFSPASANQDHEYIELINSDGGGAIDISGWQLTGGVEHTFHAGTVIPNNGRLYVSPNVKAFRTRPTSPTGDQGVFVQGGYKGHLSSWGETVNLLDKDDYLVDTATYSGNPSDQQRYLRITEIMYHPAAGGTYNDEEYEYVELTNIGTSSVLLDGAKFTDGIDYTFVPGANLHLAPGEYILLAKNEAAFASRYDSTGLNIAPGVYEGYLDNGGEKINFEDYTNSTILEFDYDDGWYDITDGEGFSLTIKDADNPDLDSWDSKSAWRPSLYSGGLPGEEDTGDSPPIGSIVINEILAHSDTEVYDWVELYNTTEGDINIGGWFLSDNNNDDPNRMKFEIAAGTIIKANKYLVFYENLHFGNPSDPGCHIPFQLSENGETVYLQSGQDGVLTGYYEKEKFGASEPDIAFGRYEKSIGTFNFVAMGTNTPGDDNAYPKVGPVVITEIMYHPATNADAEYVELMNISGSPVTLYDFITNEPWRFIDDADSPRLEYYFPTDTPVTIAPDEKVFLIKNADAFKLEFGQTSLDGITYYEWLDGSLSNGGEKPELQMPGDVDEFMTRYYIRVDRVSYDDVYPWPTEPDGMGQSLTKKVDSLNLYGNDVVNWTTATASPGL